MIIGILTVVLFIPGSSSLKEKRQALESLKKKLRNNFNVAVTQIKDADKWQKATLAIVSVNEDRHYMDILLSKLLNFIENFHKVDLIDYEMELI